MYVNDSLIDALLPKLPSLPRVEHEHVAGLTMSQIIDRRVHYIEGGTLIKCALDGSALGMTAIIVEPCQLSGYVTRWLDLCAKCHADVLELAANWPGDSYIQSRLHRLRNEALLARV